MSPVTSALNPLVFLVKTNEMFTRRASLDLKEAGFGYLVVSDTIKGLHQVEELQPAIVVIDHDEEPLKFCRQLRNTGSRIPVIMLIDEATVEERVTCLEAGADDYLLKPYDSEKFLQLLKIYLQTQEKVTEQLRFGELVLDLSTRQVIREGEKIDLTVKEFELLKYLMSHPQEVLSREQILENVWGYDFRGESNVIEVYIRYLRMKIDQEGKKRLIQTVRGVGYVLTRNNSLHSLS
ncbi:MAG: response regulator transcription factor [Gomphosphaeria aponina SAG 52.96 = DSM 107014]|uniref:Response regulator transcription factor n=1 Tax=Gomphosphaeria aponina SAG 52.96 = DSM 107014 TaxID=1521640 RepID=A0A941GWQ3_9CHRO|nr:response regulator transcription factor [Gomphosphaeria aponina SAG 52.96 = DSM 107014]